MTCAAPINAKVATCMGPNTHMNASTRCAHCQGMLDQSAAFQRARRNSVTNMMNTPGISAAALQVEWTKRMEVIVVGLYSQAMGGKPPHNFALCMSGSGARQEACPFSDIDCFILVPSPAAAAFFQPHSEAVKGRLMAGGGQQSGFRFCKGGLEPTGLTKTPADMIAYLNQKEAADPNDHIVSGLKECRFAFGYKPLFDEYERLLKERTTGKAAAGSKQLGLNTMAQLVKDKPTAYKPAKPNDHEINIKAQIYRPAQMIPKALCWYYGITSVDTRQQLTDLVNSKHMSVVVSQLFLNTLEDLGRMRFAAHLAANREMDELVLSGAVGPNKLQATPAQIAAIRSCIPRVDTMWKLAEEFVRQKNKKIGSKVNPFAKDNIAAYR